MKVTAHGRPRQGGVVAGRSLAIGEAAGDRDRPGPGGAGAPGRGGLADAAAAGPGRHRPLMGRSGCVGARCRRVDGRDAGRIPPDRAAAPVALLSARVHGPARRPAHVTGQPGGGPAPARSAPRGALLAQVAWRRHPAHRPAIDGTAPSWCRPRPWPSAVLSVRPP
jgi:hypothetical protein